MNEQIDPTEVRALRDVVDEFIADRIASKFKKLEKDAPKEGWSDDDVAEMKRAFEEENTREAWASAVASDAASIRLVTHTQKLTHARIKNAESSGVKICLSAPPAGYAGTVGDPKYYDAEGNAAAIPVVKFAVMSSGDEMLLERIARRDDHLALALSDDLDRGRAIVEQFSALIGGGTPASNTLAKQVYFPVQRAGGYHLISPLSSSQLAEWVCDAVENGLDGDAVKARCAGEAGAPHSTYTNLAVLMLGSGKPQNVSLKIKNPMNGRSYLLPSIPPVWSTERPRGPWFTRSVFDRIVPFAARAAVKELVGFLKANAELNNIDIRERRAARVSAVIDEVLMVAASLGTLPSGWTADSRCQLSSPERLWLDPERITIDESFARDRIAGGWQLRVASRFSSWLNNELIRQELPVGDAEARVWTKEFEAALESEDEHEL